LLGLGHGSVTVFVIVTVMGGGHFLCDGLGFGVVLGGGGFFFEEGGGGGGFFEGLGSPRGAIPLP
jgi:hypothetical protein